MAIEEATTVDIERFRTRVSAWLEANMPRLESGKAWDPLNDDDERAGRARQLQRRLYEGGYAGICYPREYGGQGLPVEYQRAFDEAAEGYDLPYIFSMPTSSICGPVILEFGTEEQKQRYIPAFLRGDELWVQFLSEPTGGSDLAGALTQAQRDGDAFVLSGAKIWSSGAHRADFGLCLARTNWDVPKHRGLTMFIVPIDAPGVTVRQIETVDGGDDFCEEFFDDVLLTADHVLGEVDQGWSVASKMLFYERTAMGGSSPYLSVVRKNGPDEDELIELAVAKGVAGEPDVLRMLGQAETLALVHLQLNANVGRRIAAGQLADNAGAMLRLFAGLMAVQRTNIGLAIAGDEAFAWEDDAPGGRFGVAYLMRQSRCISGGTVEMARNGISERLLGMPREPTPDRDVAFNQVRTNRRA